MTENAAISVDVVSDVVCPWCFIGRQRLKKAIAMAPDIDVTIRWRPFQLDPTIPEEGLDRKAYMTAKFGSEERLKEIHARMKESASGDGIVFALDDITVSPNTLDAHRVIRWAGGVDLDQQDRVVGALFSAYFEKGRNIGDAEVLADVARASGMDASMVETLLVTDADKDAVREEIATAQHMGITGVPCYLLEGKFAVVGAQDPETLADALRRVSVAKAEGTLETAAG